MVWDALIKGNKLKSLPVCSIFSCKDLATCTTESKLGFCYFHAKQQKCSWWFVHQKNESLSEVKRYACD